MTAGVILAAGAGTRFGDTPKQLAALRGRPMLQWAIDAQSAVAALDPVVVVLGARAETVAAGVELGRARAVVCPEWERGQTASLRCGLRALAETAGATGAPGATVAPGATGVPGRPGAPRVPGVPGVPRVLVTLGDSPLVSAEVIARFAAETPPVRAVYEGRPGHPVLLGCAELDALSSLRGDVEPAAPRGLLSDVRRIEVGHLCCGRDVDTPEDLEEIRDEARAVV